MLVLNKCFSVTVSTAVCNTWDISVSATSLSFRSLWMYVQAHVMGARPPLPLPPPPPPPRHHHPLPPVIIIIIVVVVLLLLLLLLFLLLLLAAVTPTTITAATSIACHYHPCYHLYAGYLQLYTSNKPCFWGIKCCSCSVFTICSTCSIIIIIIIIITR